MNWDFVEKSTAGLSSALQEVNSEMARYRYEPFHGSQARQELDNCADIKFLDKAYVHGNHSLFAAFDHAYALEKVLTNGVLTLSPWTLVRGILESCSTAHWILDTQIGYVERISRILNLRLDEIENLRKCVSKGIARRPRALGVRSSMPSPKVFDSERAELKKQAGMFGIAKKVSKKGKLIGFGKGLPSISELTDLSFNAADYYSLFSGAIHGDNWAIQGLGMRKAQGNKRNGRRYMQADISPEVAVGVVNMAADWIARTLWVYFRLFGWDLARLYSILDEACDRMRWKASSDVRFWRATSVP